MTWFKVDDGFYSHDKVVSIPRATRAEAAGTWTLCGTWSADKDRDGFVPTHMVDELGGSIVGAEALADAGLWKRRRGGFQFVNWEKFQPTVTTKIEKRRADAERQAEYRARKASNSGGSSQRDKDGVTDESVPPVPVPVPVPEVPEGTSQGKVSELRPDVARLCDLLADLIESNGSKRPVVGKTWLDAARLMVDADKRPLGEAVALMQWCQADSFWRSNILSMPKFREKYDQLRLQRASREQTGSAAAPVDGEKKVYRSGRVVA